MSTLELVNVDAAAEVRAALAGEVERITAVEIFESDNAAAALPLLERFPHLEQLSIGGDATATPEVLEALSHCELPALRELALATEDEPLGLARAGFWPRLRALTLLCITLEATTLRALFAPATAPALTQLDLALPDGLPLGSILAACPALAGLRELLGLPLDAAAVAWLARHQALEQLEAVFLPETATALTGRHIAGLRHLRLSGEVGDAGMTPVVEAFPALRELAAHDVGLSCAGAATIGARMRELEDLTLSFNEIGDEGAAALVPCLAGVRRLNLHHDGIGPAGLRALGPRLATLRELHLRGNPLGDGGAQLIAQTPMPALERLWLQGCGIGLRGARALADSTNLAKLQFLDLDFQGGPRARDCTRAIAESPHLPEALRAAWARRLPADARKPGLWERLFGR